MSRPIARPSTRWSASCARSRARPRRAASPSTRSAPAIPTPTSCAPASPASRPRPAAGGPRCSPNTSGDAPIGRLIEPRGSRRGGALPLLAGGGGGHRHDARGRRRRAVMDEHDHSARRRDQGRRAPGRPQGRAAAVAAAAHLHEADRGRGAPPPARQFDVTLPRFDLMAQLDRAPNGMTLGELSQRMMVSNGNVTGLVDRLVEQGLVEPPAVAERPPRADRQPHRRGPPRLPRDGAHERRLDRRDVRRARPATTIEALMRLLAKTKASARKAIGNGGRAMSAANPVTLPLAGYKRAACAPRRRRQGRDADARTGRRRRIRSPSTATPRSPTSSARPRRTRR